MYSKSIIVTKLLFAKLCHVLLARIKTVAKPLQLQRGGCPTCVLPTFVTGWTWKSHTEKKNHCHHQSLGLNRLHPTDGWIEVTKTGKVWEPVAIVCPSVECTHAASLTQFCHFWGPAAGRRNCDHRGVGLTLAGTENESFLKKFWKFCSLTSTYFAKL